MKTLLTLTVACLLTLPALGRAQENAIQESTDAGKINAIEQRAAELKARAEQAQVVADGRSEKSVIKKRVVKIAFDATMPMANEQPRQRK